MPGAVFHQAGNLEAMVKKKTKLTSHKIWGKLLKKYSYNPGPRMGDIHFFPQNKAWKFPTVKMN